MPEISNLDLFFIISASGLGSIGCLCLLVCLFTKCCSPIDTVSIETNINVIHTNPMHKNLEVCSEDPV
jgi:hypothetical protein